VIEIVEGEAYASENDRAVEILLLTSGEVDLFQAQNPEPLHLSKGMAVIVPAALEAYAIRGEGTLYKAGVPTKLDRK
jgi:mannose-6-phosphate isomerase class I